MVTVSAPAKIHLLGEHVVVYSKPALLAAINRRVYVKVKSQKSVPSKVEGSKVKSKEDEVIQIRTSENDSFVRKAISIFQKAFVIGELPPLEVTITSQIPTGSGLGSSAACAAAVIGALMKSVKNLWNPQRINDLAFEVEKEAHGNPSGADNTTVVFGGLVWFRREFDFLRSIWSLPMVSYKIPQFVLIDTGRPLESTKEMVEKVANFSRKKRGKFNGILQNQEEQTKKLLLSLRSGDKRELIEAIRYGERNLEMLEVVGSRAKKIIRDIEAIGGVAKVCGAGGVKQGSGILITYSNNLQKLSAIGSKHKVSISPVVLGEEGIRIEALRQTQDKQ